MKSRTRISIAQTQRLSLNTSLSVAIRVLRADAAGLTRFLEEQAAELPALVVEPPPVVQEWLPRWGHALAQMRGGGGDGVVEVADAGPSLAAHVAAGIAALRLPPRALRVAEMLAEALAPAGWLTRPLDEIAAEVGVPLPEAEAVLAQVQRLEPTGLFARNLAECLRLQAFEAGELDGVMAGVLDRLPLVAQGEIGRIARALGCTEDQVLRAIQRLRRYDPKPGARFAHGAAPVAEPDLTVRRGPAGWEVALNRGALPSLSLGQGPGRAEARALIRLVEGRNATLLKVAREILRRQAAALEQGLGALVPMRMAEVAEAVDVHRTTVSRVVAGAAVDTPRGTWWLRALFSQAVGQEDGPAAAALHEALARLVAAEDAAQPLTDDALAQALAGAGTPLARRTVAKYRGQLGIPPVHARKRAARRP
ncbi:RNA polymerase factor sigma-54 [Pseudogemmobacter blasticus]|uniref:RNA polymerase sigma-54 factor n=1 Tax=Fuscovulum blasticum DSM 2131 TaxID=1188250 RepID=A0A2T4J8B9_FUSBL|nr:RNA polymerase sigma-54 factor [Fuscovulum blasticum]PTE14150.1 RNA polymerase sigma-54 factor [Fuscovulum blasticum DSM 2131]